MKKLSRALVLVAVALLPAVAAAQNIVAFRTGPGMQFTCSAVVPFHITTRGTLWCKSTDSNKLYYTNPAGVDSVMGGGASTGNYTFSSDTMGKTAQTAANGSSMIFAPNVADGASSVGLVINNVTDLSSGKYVSWRGNNVEQFYFQKSGSGGVIIGGDSALPFVRISNASGVSLNYSTANLVVGSGIVTLADGTGSIQFSSGNVSMTAFDVSPDADNTRTFGGAHLWKSIRSQHIVGGGTSPTKAAGACIGGTQTVTLDANASDSVGTLTLTGTATGTASATCATITFNGSYASTGAGNAPHCQITPSNAAASALSGTAALFVDSASTTTTTFVVKVGSTALVAGTYVYTYDCAQ